MIHRSAPSFPIFTQPSSIIVHYSCLPQNLQQNVNIFTITNKKTRHPCRKFCQAIPLLFCLWRLILSSPTILTPFACPTIRSDVPPLSSYNNDHHQENFELSKGCYVKGWGKDIFGKEGEYQVIFAIIQGEYWISSAIL